MEIMNTLESYGWEPFFERFADRYLATGLMRGRVLETRRSSWIVLRESAKGLVEGPAVAAGRLLHTANQSAELPVTGDWVLLEPPDASGSDGPALIREVLPRRTRFSRKAPGEAAHDKVTEQVIAANIDTALIVAAAGRDWNPRRIERYGSLVWESGAQPVLVITKTDLAADVAALVAEGTALLPLVPVFAVSALTGAGLQALSDLLRPARTTVLLGSSGAGKSTLLNALAGMELQKTAAVREDDQRGRHTTTGRRLFRLESGSLIIDTPGLRELQLWTDQAGVDAAFPDLEILSQRCRFRDCRHEGEPGCAVRQAVADGELSADRVSSWHKLRREIAYLERRGNPVAEAAEKAKWKEIGKLQRSFKKAGR